MLRFLYGLLVGCILLAGYASWVALEDVDPLPPETWAPVVEGLRFIVPPPGSIIYVEIVERDGGLYWRLGAVGYARLSNEPTASPQKPPMLRPWYGEDQNNPIIEAGKKQKYDKPDKYGRITDSNRDGVVEFALPLFRLKNIPGYVHICCGCALTHSVSAQIISGPLGMPWVYMRWEVDDRATHMNRIRQLGPNYWRLGPTTEDMYRDPWGAENQPE